LGNDYVRSVQDPEDVPRVVRPRRVEQQRPRRRPILLVLGVVAALIVVGAAVLVTIRMASSDGTDGASDRTPATASTAPMTAPTTTSTTEPPNDLLAPAPTVLPALDQAGMAPSVRRVDTTDRVIFITIDDGQIRDPSYLEHFERLGVPFSSFLTQPMAKADPEFWKATLARGGSIQTHTISHPNLRAVGPAAARREICDPADTFTELFGTRPTLFRPPYGNSNDAVRSIAQQCGYRAVVLWTGSTNNGKLTMQDVHLQPGDIILMHYRDTLNADLDDVVARARAEGYRIGRLEDYLVQP